MTLQRLLRDLPIPRKLTLIMALFSGVVITLVLLSYFGMEILSGSRAYVGGEGLWSKAEKGAIYRLSRYALYHDESDYQKYLSQVTVTQGDHQARLELGKAKMDFALVSQGFMKGRNHPADIPTMAFMAREFSRFPYMGKALEVWGQADFFMEKFQDVARQLHDEISSSHPSSARVKRLLNEMQALDARLTPLEDEFSYTLGAGARWLKSVLLAVMAGATGLFLTAALIIAFRISRHLCREIDRLRSGAARIASGDFNFTLDTESKDEIGDLARSFQRMAAQRQQVERLKDEFFANVSHELRTPLTLILSPLESLLSADFGPLDPALKPALEIMHNNAVRLLQLMNGLLDFAKLEAGKLQVQREPIRIAELTEAVYNDFKPLIRERGLLSTLDMDPLDAVVLMDRNLYERILFNLLSNALKFTKPGGRVTVRMAWAADRLRLSVSDTGIGIPAEELQNIFQRFRQVEGSSTRRFEGTGLGLALVKEFATLLNGALDVTSAAGKGSVFTLVCEAVKSDARAAEEPALAESARRLRFPVSMPQPVPATSHPLPGETAPKVLIAEDNVELASYITTLLQAFCYTRVARNGVEALAILREWDPDLLLADVMMPERDGLSLCRDVKADKTTAAIPVVMLTALTHRDALLEGWKAGADEYLFKPFHPKELVTRVHSLLKTRREKELADDKIKLLNESLQRHARDLEAANQELEAFSYSVSHDLRTPLRAIDGFSKELLQNCAEALDARGKDDLQRIRRGTQHMAQLIEDLLELSRLSRTEPARETVDLVPMVQEIFQKLQASAPERRVAFTVPSNLMAFGDPHLLRIVLENLLQNAWKFTQRQPAPKIEVGLEGSTFFVRDNGVGFSMAFAAKLFQAFQRLHDAKEFPGTGIGLALIQRIIRRHGGRIWAQAEENRGATFYFTVPPAVCEMPEGNALVGKG